MTTGINLAIIAESKLGLQKQVSRFTLIHALDFNWRFDKAVFP